MITNIQVRPMMEIGIPFVLPFPCLPTYATRCPDYYTFMILYCLQAAGPTSWYFNFFSVFHSHRLNGHTISQPSVLDPVVLKGSMQNKTLKKFITDGVPEYPTWWLAHLKTIFEESRHPPSPLSGRCHNFYMFWKQMKLKLDLRTTVLISGWQKKIWLLILEKKSVGKALFP